MTAYNDDSNGKGKIISIEFCNLMILNKTDLLTKEQLMNPEGYKTQKNT